MKKPDAASPSQPGKRIHLYVAGLSPSLRNSVMAQMFNSIHELTGSLTQGVSGIVGCAPKAG